MKNEIPVLLFSLSDEFFGIDVKHVRRVISLEKLMRIPKAPEFISGAINLEGNVIPVVDLARKIELGLTKVNERTKVIILEIHHQDETIEAGVLIDEVLDVITVLDSKVLPPALDRMGFNTQILDGMYKVDDRFYMLINATKVFEKELANIII